MKQADLDTLKSMDHLDGDSRWKQVQSYLRDAYEDAVHNLLNAPVDELQDYRAEANVLKELIDTIDDAPDAVRRATELDANGSSTTGTPT